MTEQQLRKIIMDLIEEDTTIDVLFEEADATDDEKEKRKATAAAELKAFKDAEKAKKEEAKAKKEAEVKAKKEAAEAEAKAKKEAEAQAKKEKEDAEKEQRRLRVSKAIKDTKAKKEAEAKARAEAQAIIDAAKQEGMKDGEVPPPEEVEPVRIDYNSIPSYVTTVKTVGVPSTPVPGFYYSFDYDFDKTTPDEKLPYYDKAPLVLLFETDITSEGHRVYYGFNFHFISAQARAAILGPKTKGADTYKRSPATYDASVSRNSAFKVIVRMYRADRMRNVYKIPSNGFRELCKYTVNTYYRKNYFQVVQYFKNEMKKVKK